MRNLEQQVEHDLVKNARECKDAAVDPGFRYPRGLRIVRSTEPYMLNPMPSVSKTIEA